MQYVLLFFVLFVSFVVYKTLLIYTTKLIRGKSSKNRVSVLKK